MNARYLQPVLEVRPTDGDSFTGDNVVMYPLTLEPVGDAASIYRGEFDANRTGEIFLFANDAMIPLTSSWWGVFGYRYFYEESGTGKPAELGNRGSACVTITPLEADMAATGAPPAGPICAEAGRRRLAR